MISSIHSLRHSCSIILLAMFFGCTANGFNEEQPIPAHLVVSASEPEQVDEVDIFHVRLDTDWRSYQRRYNAVTSAFPDHKYLNLFKQHLLIKLVHLSDFLSAEDVSCEDVRLFVEVYEELKHAYPEENFMLLELMHNNCGEEYSVSVAEMAATAYQKGLDDYDWRKELAGKTDGLRNSTRAGFEADYDVYMPKLKKLASPIY